MLDANNALIENCAIGDALVLPKKQGITRLHFQNLNGASLQQHGTWEQTCEDWKSMEIDIALACEHKIDTTQQENKAKMYAQAIRMFGQGTFKLEATSTPNRAHRGHGKSGGTLAMIIGPTKGRIVQSVSDEAGRWVSITLRRQNKPNMTVICTYQVHDVNPQKAGPSTYATGLLAHYTDQERNDPTELKKHHALDLLHFVKQCQQKGESVIVAGDLNETLGDTIDGMTKLVSECGLVDAIADKHAAMNFSTYQRGRRVIDYCLVDPELLPTIVKCGYEPFKAHIMSDHRGLFIDFSTAHLFGNSIQPLEPIALRDISSQKPHQIAPYFEQKYKFLKTKDWFKSIKSIQTSIQTRVPNHSLAETLYRDLVESCRHAGSLLKRYPPAPYSPEIARLRVILRLLRLAISQLTTRYNFNDTIEETKKKLGSLGVTIPATLMECRKMLEQREKEFKATVREETKTKQLRRKHQDQLAKEYEEKGEKKEAAIIRRIQRAEKVKKVFLKCRNARNLSPKGGLASLLVPEDPSEDPKSCSNWRHTECPEEIIELLQERNRAHFGQSRDCNLTSEPFDFTMEFTGACHRAEALLNGTFVDDPNLCPEIEHGATDQERNIRELSKIFFQACKYVNEEVEDKISFHLTDEEYKGKIQKWDERTSTSPGSNMHLGHLKAYWARHTLPKESDEEKELDSMRDEILQGHLLLLNYALQFGYSFDCWKMVVNTMLEKDPGNPKIHRLRVIHLYEADYNLILAVKWRQLLHFACDNQFINPSHFGSQPGKEALDAVFIREMEYEISRLTRKPVLHFDNDATSCYDRINVCIANVISRKYGMHRKVCLVEGRTLAEARYHLKTKLGVSEEFVQHSRLHPWFGTGQGSGDSPCKWLLISSTLFDIYETRAKGALYESPDGKWSLQLHLVGFVDDVRNSINDFRNDCATIQQIGHQAERDCQLWHDLLWVVNQKLELPKCGYHAISYEFLSTGQPKIANSPTNVVLKDPKGTSLQIQQWGHDKAAKYLGNQESISNKHPQYQTLMDKCNEFARVIHCSHLSPMEVQTFYLAIYRLSAGYVLPTSHFTEKELQKIQTKVHQAAVAKSGFNRNTPKSALYGPHYMGGAGFFHLYDDQGYGQIKLLMKSWRSPDTTQGKLLRITLAWAQFCVGTSIPILSETGTKLPHLEAEWLQSMRQFLNDVGGSIETLEGFVEPKQREGDSFLMDLVLQSGKFKPTEIKRVNYCRLYLNVLLVSDITTANGRCIRDDMYAGTAPRATTPNMVTQQKPSDKAWRQWRKLLRLLTRANLQLKEPLGKWVQPWHKLRQRWKFLYDPESDKLFRYTQAGYTQHEKITFDYDKDANQEVIEPEIGPKAVPVDVVERPFTWSIRSGFARAGDFQEASRVAEVGSWVELLPTMDHWEWRLLFDVEMLYLEEEIWTELTTRVCYIATDGSAPDGKGSYAWVISDQQGNVMVQGKGAVFGAHITSYRAEGYGILAVLRFLVRLKQVHQKLGGPSIDQHLLVCDNQSMVDKVNEIRAYKTVFPNTTMDQEWDVLAEIRTAMLELHQSQPRLEHIKGHQDDHRPIEELSTQAQLNCKADKLANTYLLENPNMDHSRVPILPSSGCQLQLPKGTITHDLKQELKHARSVPALKKYLCTKNAWSEAAFDDIDWTAHGQALKRLRRHRKTLVQYLIDWLPIGSRVHKYDPKYPAHCPSCPAPVEDKQHLQQCPAHSRNLWRKDAYSAMKKVLEATNTAVPLQELFLSALKVLMHGQPLENITVDPAVADVAAAQAQIGWEQILKGRLSKTWRQAQDRYLGKRASKRSNGSVWMIKIIETWLSEWLKMWKLRNEDRHGRDSATRQQAEERQAIRELEQFYAANDGIVVDRLQWLFEISLETRREWSTAQIRIWLNTWKPIVDKSYTTNLATG